MMSDRLLLQSLVKIELRQCRRCQQIPTLGHRPCLKVVEVTGSHNVRHIGDEFYGVEGGDSSSSGPARGAKVFPALRKLTLEDMPYLKEWSEASSLLDLFPCLEELRIQHCPRLISIPGKFPFLRELSIVEINSMAMEKMRSKVTSLTSLKLSNVSGPRVDVILEELLENNINTLKELTITKCEDLCFFPSNLLKLVSLDMLRIRECPNLTHLLAEDVDAICSLTSLQRLLLWGCEGLKQPQALRLPGVMQKSPD